MGQKFYETTEQFEARISMVQIQKTESIFLKGMEGSSLPIVVSHGEGRAEASAEKIESLEVNNRIAMKYVDSHLDVTEYYPQNPKSWSQNGVSAVVGAGGRIFGYDASPGAILSSLSTYLVWKPLER